MTSSFRVVACLFRPHLMTRVRNLTTATTYRIYDLFPQTRDGLVKEAIATLQLNEITVGSLTTTHPSYDFHRGAHGTKDSPTQVPSPTVERVVGCACGVDDDLVKWFILKDGETHACQNCGNCYELLVEKKIE